MVVAVLLGLATVVAVALAVALLVARSRLVDRSEQIAELTSRLSEMTDQRDQAVARATAAEDARSTAEEAAAAANSVTESWRERSVAADEARIGAEEERDRALVESAEAASLAARLVDDGSADPAALWALERRRSERTWRHSVGVPGAGSPLTGADVLVAALQVEVDAAREDTGAVVDLTADLPGRLSPAASLAVLRCAQELLADAVVAGEEVTLRVGREGGDVVVAIDGIDADGIPVVPDALAVPPSRLEPGPGMVRLRGILDGVQDL